MRDLYSDVTARIVAALEAGNVPWRKPYSDVAPTDARAKQYPVNAVTNRPYSGINVVLLWLGSDHGLPRYLTFNQARDVGGNVRKGEHGRKCYFFKPHMVKDKKTGEEKKIPLLREYTVFHVSQCDNLPEHVVTGIKAGTDKPVVTLAERHVLADAFIQSTGADFREGAGKPAYWPSGDYITMPSHAAFKTSPFFYGVAFHELIHWTGSKPRLDRDLSGRFGTQAYAAEELVAELGAAFVNAEFGFDSEENNAAYIASWIRLLKEDSRAIFTAASKASKAAEYLRGLAIEADAEEEPEQRLAA